MASVAGGGYAILDPATYYVSMLPTLLHHLLYTLPDWLWTRLRLSTICLTSCCPPQSTLLRRTAVSFSLDDDIS